MSVTFSDRQGIGFTINFSFSLSLLSADSSEDMKSKVIAFCHRCNLVSSFTILGRDFFLRVNFYNVVILLYNDHYDFDTMLTTAYPDFTLLSPLL